MDNFGQLYGSNAAYMEELFNKFKQDPQSVDGQWRNFFSSLDAGYEMVSRSKGGVATAHALPTANDTSLGAQDKVSRLMQGYRTRGHVSADINPLLPKPLLDKNLQLETFGLSASQLSDTFAVDGILPAGKGTLNEIISALQNTYTGRIGVQYSELPSTEERVWLRREMESIQNTPVYSKEQKEILLSGVMKAEKFEQFIHTKYIGMKRFSIEGGESMIPMIDTMINKGADLGVEDVVMGMAHRGRLNVLVNIFEKPFKYIFAGFNDTLKMDQAGSGDVKYHMGRSADVVTRTGKKVHISMLNNPSHLEAVNPLVEGSARAKQDKKGENAQSKVLPFLIHGDAAFAGQGVVPETLNLSNLKGYTTGGTIHLVINNQVGFTANPEDSYSGDYCTDIARMLQVPIFHVNGDDVEACNHVMEMAVAYRQKFGKDVVIDLVCYRRYGHNEGDDPTFTQPKLYSLIKKQDTVYTKYKSKLQMEGVISAEEIQAREAAYVSTMQNDYDIAKQSHTKAETDIFGAHWSGFKRETKANVKTNISKKLLSEIATSFTAIPNNFDINPKIMKMMEKRSAMLTEGGMDWGAAEVSAYASLLADGYSIRLSGQDVRRGTFSHRHLTLTDQSTDGLFTPISKFSNPSKGVSIEAWNSPVSELSVLGFEFGYSLAHPHCLTIWEAQFGDFANGAQIMMDQFICSSENKWHRMSGLVMLMPHGFEGQGPEHSSCRIERYLQLCAENNMTVANVTTPAQIFHLLRRQMLLDVRRPLLVATPKSLLRHPKAISSVEDLTTGSFMKVIDDENVKATQVQTVAFCSGKIYYELLAKQEEEGRDDIALVRLEQLYPLPLAEIKTLLARYKKAKNILWVQEEPRNQGAWTFILDNLASELGVHMTYVGRSASASPAAGSMSIHKSEQDQLIENVFKFK